ncbi:DUF2023 family protein [Methylocystis sp. H62]|uniref:DUF2023 family protein n=1 Tax=Methylocystis sp. H62 TaxID=2785789 RepID=UPI001FEE4208|nr:DUF2023 family protein [Methylocystis sp. H62]
MAESVTLIGEGVQPASSMRCRAADAAPVLRLFHHNIYEYGRGVRGLFLMTLSRPELEVTLGKLERQGIHHFVQELNQFKVNLFFGRPAYVAVARSIVTRPLNALTAEEDFMLGTLLGYDREQQCRRFLTRSGRGMPENLPLAAE